MEKTEMMISSTHIGVQSVFLWYVWLCIDCISMQSMHCISIYVIVVLPKWVPDVLCFDGVYVQGLRWQKATRFLLFMEKTPGFVEPAQK